MKAPIKYLVGIVLALAVVLGALVFLAGCGGSGSSNPTLRPPTRPPVTPTDAAAPTTTKETAKPRIDVVIDDIEVPPSVKNSAPLNLTIVARNASPGGQTAGIANVEVRARISDGVGATDLHLGSTQLRNLQPNVAQEKTISVTAPNRPGLWKVTATVSGFDFEDSVNNRREATLVVD